MSTFKLFISIIITLFISVVIMNIPGTTNGNESEDPSLIEDDNEEVQIIASPETLTPAQKALWQILPAGGQPAEERTAQMGAEAIPALAEALKTENEDYIYNAAICMAFLPEPLRTDQLVSLLAHDSLDVRSEAVNALGQSYDPSSAGRMLKVLARCEDHAIRGKMALILAKERNPSLSESIQNSRLKETDTEVLHDFDLALSRLGNLEARSRIALQLRNPVPKLRVEAIRDYLYIDDVSSLQDLRSLLFSVDPLMNTRPAHSGTEVWLRNCDVAAEVIINVAKLPIASEIKNFGRDPLTDTQLEKVRAFLYQIAR